MSSSYFNFNLEDPEEDIKMEENVKIVLTDVRLSFPALFETATFKGRDTEKYGATFLIDKEDPQVLTIKKAISKVMKDARVTVAQNRICLQDGDEKDYDGYAGHMTLKASNLRRPTVLNRDKTPLTADDNVIYAGCYVNASIGLWLMNNQYGKRVNANLLGVQFAGAGQPFSAGDVDAADDFKELPADDIELAAKRAAKQEAAAYKAAKDLGD